MTMRVSITRTHVVNYKGKHTESCEDCAQLICLKRTTMFHQTHRCNGRCEGQSWALFSAFLVKAA